tara:strand:+ start:2573 stop:4030 length:1458 start_codon:yes stop_codon:yes gene_type:complete
LHELPTAALRVDRAEAREHAARLGDHAGAVQALLERLWGQAPRHPERWVRALEAEPCLRAGVGELVAREAFEAHDHGSLRRAIAAVERAGDDLSAARWRALANAPTSDLEGLEALEARARTEGRSVELVDLVMAQAAHLAAAGDAPNALARARRALRMAGAEGLPLQELQACLGLAAARRERGEAHLARRALALVAPLAPSGLQGSIRLEQVLAGLDAPRAAEGSPADEAAHALARHAAGEPFAAGSLDLLPVSAELVAVARRAMGTGDGSAWAAGETHRVPRGLIAFGAFAATTTAPAFVVASPEGARRVLGAGLNHLPQVERIDTPDAPQERTVMAVAWLALHRAEVAEELFFERLYGFPYEQAIHRSVLNKLLSRARQLVADRGELVREDGRIALRVERPFALWDPRCAPGLEERLMVALGGGPRSAADVAGALGYSKRAVQLALKSLVDEGACRPVQEGRHVHYVLEDTALTSLTVSRFQR